MVKSLDGSGRWPVFPILRPLTVQLWLPRAPPSTLYKLLPLATTAVNSLHRYNEDLVFWFMERSNWIIFVNPWHSRESCLLIYQLPLGKNLVEITVWKNSERYDALGHFTLRSGLTIGVCNKKISYHHSSLSLWTSYSHHHPLLSSSPQHNLFRNCLSQCYACDDHHGHRWKMSRGKVRERTPQGALHEG